MVLVSFANKESRFKKINQKQKMVCIGWYQNVSKGCISSVTLETIWDDLNCELLYQILDEMEDLKGHGHDFCQIWFL